MVGQQLCAKNVKNTEACVRVSVFVDERKNRTIKKRASERKTAGMENGRPPHFLFRVLTQFFVDIDTCININLDHRPTFARGTWRVFLVIAKVHQFSKITTTQQ